ncbi:MAG: hypothetical protein A2505_08550 [Deltaproteobacteria bacterium RIFOXYD12_FULL_55_16]|nr:MAG: hypothetical protein A2505_08550 [Deltaproteobacteria bacterium RIFOXYD12_FULL_55_16]
MIRFASAKDIYVFISSNFSFAKPDEFFDDLVASGLNRLIISLDGTCEETYATYRVDGNFELVLDNMKKMVAAKKRVHSKTPEIIWQFLVNRFNEDEIDTAKAMAINLGVTLDLKLMDVSDNLVDVELDTTLEQRKAHWLGRNQKYICERYKNEIHYPVFKGICAELFTDLVVTVDGKVLPCCGTWDKNSTFGDLLTQSFHDIWFGQQYVNSRLKFFKKDFYPEVTTTCFRCLNFGTDPSWKDKLRLLGVILQKRILMPMYVLLQSYKGR